MPFFFIAPIIAKRGAVKTQVGRQKAKDENRVQLVNLLYLYIWQMNPFLARNHRVLTVDEALEAGHGRRLVGQGLDDEKK
jgi:hypothetical protein